MSILTDEALTDLLSTIETLKNGSTDRHVALKKIKASLGDHTILRLSCKDIGDEGLTALAEVLPKSQIRTLYLCGNEISDEGLTALAEVLPKSQINNLDLSYNKISDVGIAALAAVLSQSQINSLYLGHNNIGVEGATALAEVFPQSQIISLNLSYNNIGVEGATALAAVLSQSQINSLYLAYNNIGHEGLTALAEVLPKSQIDILSLIGNEISDVGIAVLAEVLPQSQITSLLLSYNNIGVKGATALAAVLPQSQISKLYLSNNEIGDKGIKVLFKACCECAEQGRLFEIQGVFFTQKQQDEIQQKYDATVKLTYALKVLSVSKGLSDRLAADSELIEMPEELLEMIAVQLPLCSNSVSIQRVIEERAANIEQIENIQQHLLSQKNIKIFGGLLTAGIVLVGAGFVGWALQTGFMTAPGFISSKITAQISAMAWTPVTAALACAGIATIVGLALIMLMRAVGCRTQGEDMNPQRPQGSQAEPANTLQPPGEEIHQVNLNQGQSSDGTNLGRALASSRK